MKQINQENMKLKAEIVKQEDRIQKLKREIRNKNIIVKGVNNEKNEKDYHTKDKIREAMKALKANIDEGTEADEVKRIGKYKKGRKRPLLVKLMEQS